MNTYKGMNNRIVLLWICNQHSSEDGGKVRKVDYVHGRNKGQKHATNTIDIQ